MSDAIAGEPMPALAGLRSPFDDLLGLEWEAAGPQRVVATLVVDSRHHQPFGLVHGGVYATMVETLASVGATLHVGAGHMAVGVHNATDFLRPHSTGRLRGVGEPLHVGRSQHLWQVIITRDRDGATVARGQVRLAILPRPASADGPADDRREPAPGDGETQAGADPAQTTRRA